MYYLMNNLLSSNSHNWKYAMIEKTIFDQQMDRVRQMTGTRTQSQLANLLGIR